MDFNESANKMVEILLREVPVEQVVLRRELMSYKNVFRGPLYLVELSNFWLLLANFLRTNYNFDQWSAYQDWRLRFYRRWLRVDVLIEVALVEPALDWEQNGF